MKMLRILAMAILPTWIRTSFAATQPISAVNTIVAAQLRHDRMLLDITLDPANVPVQGRSISLFDVVRAN